MRGVAMSPCVTSMRTSSSVHQHSSSSAVVPHPACWLSRHRRVQAEHHLDLGMHAPTGHEREDGQGRGIAASATSKRKAPVNAEAVVPERFGNRAMTAASLSGLPGKVAHQGCAGAYTEVAARLACPGFLPRPCKAFEEAFVALSSREVDRAVQPIENSMGGTIHTVVDLMLRFPDVHIVAETSLVIAHNLCVLPGTKREDINLVMSHPQALAQCDGYIRSQLNNIARKPTSDTASASRMVAEQRMAGVAAISSTRAAQLYGLEVLEPAIQDDKKGNVTRFVVLSREPHVVQPEDTRPHRTSVVFTLEEGSGQLFKSLSAFALRELDLLKIESRPVRDNPLVQPTVGPRGVPYGRFNYLFYVDFAGKLCDDSVQNALRHLREMAPEMRVLGSFPMDLSLGNTNVETMFAQWDAEEKAAQARIGRC